MTQVDLQSMRDFVAEHYATQVQRVGGDSAVAALRRAINAAVRLYDHFEPPHPTGEWALLVPLEGAQSIVDAISPDFVQFTAAETAGSRMQPGCVVAALPGGVFLVWDHVKESDLKSACKQALCYRFRSGAESFELEEKVFSVQKTFAAVSVFAVPAFRDLLEALQYYDLHFCRHTQCFLLQDIWHDDGRLRLNNKPEATMRRSLDQYLRGVLRDAEVRPEQNVDETHPVDIKVTWTAARRIALIEIKWVGDSVDEYGKTSTVYRDARARSGAKQLADYLDENAEYVPGHVCRGYLVVFDARRGKIDSGRSDHLLSYQHTELSYDPKYDEERTDFAPPLRFYMRPVVAN